MKGRTWIRFGSNARIPLAYVDNAADAIALAVDMPKTASEILNVVDDDCPTQREYMKELSTFFAPHPIIIPFSFWALRWVSGFIWALARCFGQKDRVPLTLRPMCLDAMAKPMRYPNDHIKQVLGWEPRVKRVDALQQIFRHSL
jgi:nucleoside-diphosphate-sugar epimerase